MLAVFLSHHHLRVFPANPVANREMADDHSTSKPFFDYYATQSQQQSTIRRLSAYRDTILHRIGPRERPLDVAEFGCGAGMQSLLWAKLGHRVHGLDVSRDLLELARTRVTEAGYEVDFQLAPATDAPWADGSMDVCLAVELLEHVPNWQRCLDELARVLRSSGVLFLTTTNKLCPKQQEFDLPLYSWYPGRLKRYYERLAVTSRPELVQHATHPAVNWFSYRGLRDELQQRGCECFDRFDLMNPDAQPLPKRMALRAARAMPALRTLLYLAVPSTWVLGIKQ
jgi:2-polyprenyl-3-methyl-5-hydroxy-6-metoxy-1,4-benzoquinol methylase